MSSTLFSSPVSIFMMMELSFLSGAYYFYPFCFGLLLWLDPLLTFGRCFSVSPFYLTFCICFHVLGKSHTFLVLNDMSLLQRGPAVSYSAVSPVLQGLALQGVSPTCVPGALLLSLGLFFF